MSELHIACQKWGLCVASWWPKLLFMNCSKSWNILKVTNVEKSMWVCFGWWFGRWVMRIRDWYVLPVYTRFFKDFKSNSQFLLSSLELLEVNSFLCHGVWGKLPLQPMHTLWGIICSKPNLNKVRLEYLFQCFHYQCPKLGINRASCWAFAVRLSSTLIFTSCWSTVS